jgi:hypothetical protein
VRFRTTCVSSEDGAQAQEAAQPASGPLLSRVIDEDNVTRATVEAGVDRDLIAAVEQRKSKPVGSDKLLPARTDDLSLVCTDKLFPDKLSPDYARLRLLMAETSAA